MDISIRKLDKKVDDRGFVVEILRSEQVNATFGQIFISTVKPGKVKGNHYHKRKREFFHVVKGKVKFHFLDVKTGERKEQVMDEKIPSVLQINPGVSHAITNNGRSEAILLVYVSESFNPSDPDTFQLEVVKP